MPAADLRADRRGATLVLVSHDASAIERVCERVIVIDDGRVVFDGPTAEGLLHYRRLMGTEHGGGESVRPHGTTRDARGSDLELRDGLGRAAALFHGGAALSIVIGLRAVQPILGRLRSSLELRAASGTALFATPAPVELAPDGTATLAFEIPDLALLGGDYDIAVGAGADATPIVLDRSSRFAVAREPSSAEGIVDLRGAWRTAATAESRATRPEDAVQQARDGAAEMRRQGAYGEARRSGTGRRPAGPPS